MRIWTGLKIFIELRDGVTLQLPFREASKVCARMLFFRMFAHSLLTELAMGR